MENTLERLVDRIYNEGISRADDRAASIISAAEANAKDILAKADAEASRRLKDAADLAAKTIQDTQVELQGLAARALAELRRNISALLVRNSLEQPLGALLADVDFVKTLIIELISNHSADDLTIILPMEKRDSISDELSKNMAAKLPNLEIIAGHIKNGFIVKAKNTGFEIEFTEESFIEFLKPLAKQATASLFG